jgi:hypothetical protein
VPLDWNAPTAATALAQQGPSSLDERRRAYALRLAVGAITVQSANATAVAGFLDTARAFEEYLRGDIPLTFS